MKKKYNVIVVIAAFNEEKKIGKVVDDVAKYADKIVVIDDGSTDKTGEVIINPKAIVLKHKINLGQGAALQTGFDYVKKLNPKVVVTYDADGQFVASEIPQMVKPILDGDVDVILGSRFMGRTENMDLLRKLILKAGVLFTYIFSEIKLTDTHNGFRALNLKALNTIMITQDRMAHASEIIDQVVINDLKYMEVPVTVRYDKYSKNKGQSNLNALTILFKLILNKLY